MTEIMPVPRKLRITVLPAGSFADAFCFGDPYRESSILAGLVCFGKIFSLARKLPFDLRLEYIKTKNIVFSGCVLSEEMTDTQNFGRELDFSADWCYNEPNEKPPLCKGRWQPKADGGIVKSPK